MGGGKTMATIADGTSACCNQLLMQLLRSRQGDGRPVYGQGAGMVFINAEMKRLSLPLPEISADATQFRITLYRPQAGNPAQTAGTTGRRAVTSRMRVIASLPHRAFSSHDVARATGLSMATVRRILRGLVEEGILTSHGRLKSRGRYYERAGLSATGPSAADPSTAGLSTKAK